MKKKPRPSRKAVVGEAREVFTEEERAAIRELARERKAAGRHGSRADEERAVLEKIQGMPEPDRAMAMRLHAIIRASAPALVPRLWYGMPAYVLGFTGPPADGIPPIFGAAPHRSPPR